jgi:hypothetical protein
LSLSDRYTNFPRIDDRADWQTPIALYDADRMVEAYAATTEIGLGLAGRYLPWYRMIEAEFLTRERAEVVKATNWLTVEAIPEEVGDSLEPLIETAKAEFDYVAARFDYTHESDVRLAIMAIESDAPWTAGRFGFCVKKHPYFKICIPNSLLSNEVELGRTLRHEYAHVVSGTLSHGLVPRWLDEAIAVVVEGGVGREPRRSFVLGKRRWLSPTDLAAAFRQEGEADVWYAYQQAGLIGEYLAQTYGERTLGDLMRAFANNSLWTELMLVLKGKPPVAEALDEAYHVSVEGLFAQALEWLRGKRGESP